MKEEIISFQTGKLAKEKGFSIVSTGFYDENKELDLYESYIGDDIVYKRQLLDGIVVCEAPTQSLLQKWLREKHRIFIIIYKKIGGWSYYLDEAPKINLYDTYEEALEKGLQEALKLIKT